MAIMDLSRSMAARERLIWILTAEITLCYVRSKQEPNNSDSMAARCCSKEEKARRKELSFDQTTRTTTIHLNLTSQRIVSLTRICILVSKQLNKREAKRRMAKHELLLVNFSSDECK